MQTDHELLELAAKAASITGEFKRTHQAYGDQWIEGIDTGARFWWNPLTDDGDALRLAVELGMSIEVHVKRMDPYTVAWFDVGCCVEEGHWDDATRATRRAIVRAAAEIGRTKT